ncbi:hypothetical protein QX204_34345 (plasmid) [Nocardia sp. PE-7]|uniref:hypothetical protein n=1 Tax=Nocardia sp. PE-7 TaxID=3058426 RepID=UPI0026592891|nr:hypothetical protein [Nocardia sp. PE-7]WKG13567.1 hypothetical protein QX204_34345 [Nocardia sp. PE-7]
MSFGEWMATRCVRLLGGGLWAHLNVRVQSKTALEIERERNRATAEDIRVLPHGAKLIETEVGGRTRVIVMPEPVAGPVYATGTVDAVPVTENGTPLTATPQATLPAGASSDSVGGLGAVENSVSQAGGHSA